MEVEKILVPIILIPLIVIILISTMSGVDDSSSGSETETLTVNTYGSAISLREDYVETGTESVTNVTGDVLSNGVDYTFDYTNGRAKSPRWCSRL